MMHGFEAFVFGTFPSFREGCNVARVLPRLRSGILEKRSALKIRLGSAGGRNLDENSPNFQRRQDRQDFTPKPGAAGGGGGGGWPGTGPAGSWPKPLNKSDLGADTQRDPLFESLFDPKPANKRNKPKTSKKPVVDKLQASKQKYYFDNVPSAADEYDVFAHLLESESISKYTAHAEVEWFDTKRFEAESKSMKVFPSATEIQDLLYDSLMDTEGKRWRETVIPSNIRILLVLLQVSEIDVEFARYLEYFHSSFTLTPNDGIQLIVVTREKPTTNRKTMRKLNLRFPLLSDEQGALGRLFGTGNRPHLVVFYREKMPSGIDGWYFDRCARAELPSKLMENVLEYARKLLEQRQQAKMATVKGAGSSTASTSGSPLAPANVTQQAVPISKTGPSASSAVSASPPQSSMTEAPPQRSSERGSALPKEMPSRGARTAQPLQPATEDTSEYVKQTAAPSKPMSWTRTPSRDTSSPRNESKGRLVLNHSTHLEGLIPVLERLAKQSGIRKIVPGRLYAARSNAERLSIRVTVPVAGGWKLVARKGTQVQDIFITLENPNRTDADEPAPLMTKEQLERCVEEATAA
ncbi:hypothetical protein CCYA_CCYA01G0367 [Cyanidiococcus yangmingshanensis]|nr:hypothetical protein CCYA_CCYA01G0367 [Cyanidiococcus yangmingshanensis]